ncbi:DUF2946 family protein [Verticiella sediminum]|uniref:DUF2946 family protein n=1 Tax=Verticiella sediminum TaxID=1247510 RepID=A0A556AVG4_9BURK|nr:DUF2946 family protein [Verticiella sediminum]TSH96917.1 DUF2946 family protein [Verticiella sediminum]
MDDSVKAAMQRWPNVPAVYGWLSLDARGQWHLHPEGKAADGGPGESITSPQILAFINRNYAHERDGRWYFQNGPQRVYVRIDAAPLILRIADAGIGLQTHTGQPVLAVSEWLLSADGRLYARTGLGPAMLEDRDLAPWLETLRDEAHGSALLDVLAADPPAPASMRVAPNDGSLPAAPLLRMDTEDLAGHLGFTRMPRAPD